jgi:glycerol-3-phosphate acyltransferase PlsY
VTSIALLIVAFLCGSIPFSVWLGKLFLGKDVRSYGDGNPGAANVFRAGARGLGLVVVILDVSKAAAPVGLAYNDFGVRGLPMVMISVAPLLGHVFCPFLRFKGGKGLATALGVWIGLTIWKASLAGVLATLLGIALTTNPAWAVMLGLTGILTTLLVWLPDPLFLAVWVAVTVILAWTHRDDLRRRPRLRAWLRRGAARPKHPDP